MSIASIHVQNGAADDVRIGEWRLAARRNELLRGGEVVRLEPKVAELLAYLAGRPGEVVGREELLAAVWPGVVVGDDALTQAVIKLRKALGDDAHAPKYIETIPKRGYRLVAPDGGRRSRRRLVPLGALAIGGLALVAAAFWIARPVAMPWPLAQDPRAVAVEPVPRVAVLPFANPGGDPQREYLSDGLTEDIIIELGRFAGLRVMSYIAVQGYKGKVPTTRTVRDQLASRYVVTGSVREADGRLRVGVELADAERGTSLWAERYEEDSGKFLEIQERIVRRIVGTLNVQLAREEIHRAVSKPNGNLDDYDLKLRARAMIFRQDRRANMEGRAILAKVLAASPDDADALGLMGAAEFERAVYGWVEDATAAAERAESFARRAVASPDTRSHYRAYGLLAVISSNNRRFEESLEYSARALALNPGDSGTLLRRGSSLLYAGRIDEAIAIMESARVVQPNVGPGNSVNFAYAYYLTGRYREAISITELMLERYPNDVSLLAVRTAALAQAGDRSKAQESARQVMRINPGFRVRFFGTRFADPVHVAKVQEGLLKASLE
jgi:TolB-like protein/DNA-binding winged helix-turn-helix (wHTH) protein